MCARCLDQSIRPRTSCLASCAKMACHAASQKEFVCIHCDMRTHVPTHSSHGLVSSSSPTLEQGIRRLSMPSPSKQSAVSTARISGSSIAQISPGRVGGRSAAWTSSPACSPRPDGPRGVLRRCIPRYLRPGTP